MRLSGRLANQENQLENDTLTTQPKVAAGRAPEYSSSLLAFFTDAIRLADQVIERRKETSVGESSTDLSSADKASPRSISP